MAVLTRERHEKLYLEFMFRNHIMTFAFIGCKTDFYLSLHNHFLEKNDQLRIYTTVDALLNETFMDSFNALIIDYDSHPSSYNVKLVHFLKFMYPDIPVLVLVTHDTDTMNQLLSSGLIICIQKTLPTDKLSHTIYNSSLKKRVAKNSQVAIGEDYVFDMNTSILYYKNIAQRLTNKEMAFLQLLIKNGGNFISLSDIGRLLYADNLGTKDVAIRSIIMRFRKKLKEDIIETFPRFGYRLKPSALMSTQRDKYDKEI